MTRMTERCDYGIKVSLDLDFSIDPADYDTVQKILARLADYEDIGLEPEQFLRPGDLCPCCGEPILTTDPLKLVLLSVLKIASAEDADK